MSQACTFHAHLAYLYRNLALPELNFRAVSTLLVAQCFLTVNHRFLTEPKADGSVMRSESRVEHNALGITEVRGAWIGLRV